MCAESFFVLVLFMCTIIFCLWPFLPTFDFWLLLFSRVHYIEIKSWTQTDVSCVFLISVQFTYVFIVHIKSCTLFLIFVTHDTESKCASNWLLDRIKFTKYSAWLMEPHFCYFAQSMEDNKNFIEIIRCWYIVFLTRSSGKEKISTILAH